jgi:DNA-binding response OmpR family regulator
MRILIVEDTPSDRELLRYLLEDRFKSEAKFREASTLEEALSYLARGNTDCIILDLQLPDSTGKDTFKRISERYPGIPIIVMTHNKDRDLAIEMIQEGAADYVLKSYTDEEELFRRVIFAVEKHRRSVRMPSDHVNSIHRVEKAKADMINAHQSGSHAVVREKTVETTSALADLSQKLFTEVQKISNAMVQQGAQQEHVAKTVDTLDRELLRGHSGRPSMRSQVDLMAHRLDDVEGDVQGLQERLRSQDQAKASEAIQLKQTKMSNRTKLLIALIALVGALASAAGTYAATKAKDAKQQEGK